MKRVNLISACSWLLIFGLVMISCSKDFEENPIEFKSAPNSQTFAKAKKPNEGQMEKFSIEKQDGYDEGKLKLMVESIGLLSKLQYPIKNLDSFHKVLNESADKSTVETILETFEESDFPLYSAQHTFAGYYDRNSLFADIYPYLPELPELPELEPQRPSVCEVLQNDPNFSTGAKNCGCATYVAALRAGLNNWQAIIEAVFAAQYYDRYGICR